MVESSSAHRAWRHQVDRNQLAFPAHIHHLDDSFLLSCRRVSGAAQLARLAIYFCVLGFLSIEVVMVVRFCQYLSDTILWNAQSVLACSFTIYWIPRETIYILVKSTFPMEYLEVVLRDLDAPPLQRWVGVLHFLELH